MTIFRDRHELVCIDCLNYQLEIQQLKKILITTDKELGLYKRYCARPRILKEVIHHPARPRDSQCLYGIKAWDEYVYK